jgi:hypothetical protein
MHKPDPEWGLSAAMLFGSYSGLSSWLRLQLFGNQAMLKAFAILLGAAAFLHCCQRSGGEVDIGPR